MIRLKMRNYNMILTEKQQKILLLSSGKIDKYEYLTGEELLPLYQSRIIEQAKCTYSPLKKVLEKQMETTEDQEKKQTDAITNQKKRLAALTNKDDENLSHKEIFKELVREGFDEIRELTNEANLDDLIYYLKGNTARKIFDDFDKIF